MEGHVVILVILVVGAGVGEGVEGDSDEGVSSQGIISHDECVVSFGEGLGSVVKESVIAGGIIIDNEVREGHI